MPAEVANQEDEKTKLKAIRQVEFYFADSNLPYDKFMWTLHSKLPDHWVPIETIASFKRMREFQPFGLEWLVDALKLSDFLEVDETKTKLRRSTEVTEPKDQFQRSIYAKGFGDETSTLQAELEEYFDKFGRVNAVRMRRDQEKKFKTSIFVEFADFSTVEKVLKSDPQPTWNGEELLIMSKEAYCDKKIEEKGLKGKAAENRKDAMNNRGFNAFRLMGQEKDSSSSAAQEVYLDFLGHKVRIYKDEKGNGTIKDEDVPFVRGATLRFDGCGGAVSWSDIKVGRSLFVRISIEINPMQKDPIKQKFDGKAPFIKYTTGDDFGLVGFHKVLSEEDVATIKETVKTINSHEVDWSIADESAEKSFQIERAQTAARNAFGMTDRVPQRGRGGKAGRGGRGGRGGGRRDGRRDRDNGKARSDDNAAAGEKRKPAVEPDGGPDVGTRGTNAPPTLQTAKKVKTEDGEANPS
jgi:lupus La protein